VITKTKTKVTVTVIVIVIMTVMDVAVDGVGVIEPVPDVVVDVVVGAEVDNHLEVAAEDLEAVVVGDDRIQTRVLPPPKFSNIHNSLNSLNSLSSLDSLDSPALRVRWAQTTQVAR
jgi:hypothetical protein